MLDHQEFQVHQDNQDNKENQDHLDQMDNQDHQENQETMDNQEHQVNQVQPDNKEKKVFAQNTAPSMEESFSKMDHVVKFFNFNFNNSFYCCFKKLSFFIFYFNAFAKMQKKFNFFF